MDRALRDGKTGTPLLKSKSAADMYNVPSGAKAMLAKNLASVTDKRRGSGCSVDGVEPASPIDSLSPTPPIPYRTPVVGCTARSAMPTRVAPSAIGTLEISAPVSGSMRIRSLTARPGRRRIPATGLRRAEQCAVQTECETGDSRDAGRMPDKSGASVGLADDDQRAVVDRRLRAAGHAVAAESTIEHEFGRDGRRRSQREHRSNRP